MIQFYPMYGQDRSERNLKQTAADAPVVYQRYDFITDLALVMKSEMFPERNLS